MNSVGTQLRREFLDQGLCSGLNQAVDDDENSWRHFRRPRLLRPLFFSLFHDSQQIVFRIAEPHQPQVLIRQRRDDMRWANDLHVSLLQSRELLLDVWGAKVEVSTGAGLAGTLA